MRAGNLDRTIRIDAYEAGAIDALGNPAQDWTALATVRAQLIQGSTEEFIRNGAVDEAVMIFRIRHLDGVSTACRIHYAGRYFNIKEVKEIGRRKGLELRAVALGAS